MICSNCGKEIADYLKQCPECGMPTANVPAVRSPSAKKREWKETDKPLINIPAVVNIFVSLYAVIRCCSVIVPSVLAWALWKFIYTEPTNIGFLSELWEFFKLNNHSIVWALLIYYILCFAVGTVLSLPPFFIGSCILSSKARKKKLNQKITIISICFTVLVGVAFFCALIISFAYCLMPSINISIDLIDFLSSLN